MKFLINGSIAYDLLLSHEGSFLSGIDAKNLDALSVNYLAHGFVRHHGGTAANISWNLSLLGAKPMVTGAVGTDGTEYVTMLKDRGIDVRHIETSSSAVTATAIIATDSGGRQISFFHPGADGKSAFPDLTDDSDDIVFGIMSPRNPALMMRGAQECSRLKIPYLFDPGQVVHAFKPDDLRDISHGSAGLIVNEYEWSLASKILGWNEQETAKECSMLVVTLADKGIRIVTPKEDLLIPAFKTETFVNPTGAGDAARAGLLYGLGQKWSLTQCGRLANILGSAVCEQEGTLLDALDLDDVRAKAKECYGTALPF